MHQELLEEKKKQQAERVKLDTEKVLFRSSVEHMIITSEQRRKSELELNSHPMPNHSMLRQIKELEASLKEEKECRVTEEKRHAASELEELETRKEITLKLIEAESKTEELEHKVGVIQAELTESNQIN